MVKNQKNGQGASDPSVLDFLCAERGEAVLFLLCLPAANSGWCQAAAAWSLCFPCEKNFMEEEESDPDT